MAQYILFAVGVCLGACIVYIFMNKQLTCIKSMFNKIIDVLERD